MKHKFLFVFLCSCSMISAQTMYHSATLDPSSYYGGKIYNNLYNTIDDWEYLGEVSGVTYSPTTESYHSSPIIYSIYCKAVGQVTRIKAVGISYEYTVTRNPYYRNKQYGTFANYKYYFTNELEDVVLFNL